MLRSFFISQPFIHISNDEKRTSSKYKKYKKIPTHNSSIKFHSDHRLKVNIWNLIDLVIARAKHVALNLS